MQVTPSKINGFPVTPELPLELSHTVFEPVRLGSPQISADSDALMAEAHDEYVPAAPVEPVVDIAIPQEQDLTPIVEASPNTGKTGNDVPAPNTKEAFTAEVLQAFQQKGVPTSLLSDDVNAKIAYAVSGILGGMIYQNNVILQGTQANAQYLAAQNQALRTELDGTSAALWKLEDEFRKFHKRSLQLEIKKQLDGMEAELKKLREPDITLENMAKQIRQFEAKQTEQNTKIAQFKQGCDKELEKIRQSRIAFNNEVVGKKRIRKSDIKDLEAKVDELESKIMDIETEARGSHSDDINELKIGLHDIKCREQRDLATVQHDMDVLRQHVETLLEEDEERHKKQDQLNGVLSTGFEHMRTQQQLMETALKVLRNEQ
jgi:hypothetical protein